MWFSTYSRLLRAAEGFDFIGVDDFISRLLSDEIVWLTQKTRGVMLRSEATALGKQHLRQTLRSLDAESIRELTELIADALTASDSAWFRLVYVAEFARRLRAEVVASGVCKTLMAAATAHVIIHHITQALRHFPCDAPCSAAIVAHVTEL